MTRKHFRLLAGELAAERPAVTWDANKKIQWVMCVRAVARACKVSNFAFDREKFIDATLDGATDAERTHWNETYNF